MLETLYFTIFSPMDNLNENNWQKFIIVVYIENTDKYLSARFWCYRVYEVDWTFAMLRDDLIQRGNKVL